MLEPHFPHLYCGYENIPSLKLLWGLKEVKLFGGNTSAKHRADAQNSLGFLKGEGVDHEIHHLTPLIYSSASNTFNLCSPSWPNLECMTHHVNCFTLVILNSLVTWSFCLNCGYIQLYACCPAGKILFKRNCWVEVHKPLFNWSGDCRKEELPSIVIVSEKWYWMF